ncbi:MAG: Gfo/Idh/MocA family oxidoreductase [Pirellulales bacterium]|nr:Gfo/Idh/MocA family oxidoreductase [Pirellulales bacterium]
MTAEKQTPGSAPTIVAAPRLAYQPKNPTGKCPQIGLIGCGNITQWHLKAYRAAGFHVAALCDIDRSQAEQRRNEFFPTAKVLDFAELLSQDNISVVDIATHTATRPPLVEAALRSGKHVLSQKPFVEDLAEGKRLASLAEEAGRFLAVNQNGRWAPHWSYLHEAVKTGLLGELSAIHCEVHWNHDCLSGTEFEKMHHLILYDFAIHWFDILCCLMGEREPLRVYASLTRSRNQTVSPPLLAQVTVEYEGAQASLVFDGNTSTGPWETTFVAGQQGTIRCQGHDLQSQELVMTTEEGISQPALTGTWFPDGFHGTMGELLCAIETGQPPTHSARNNLKSLALCFAAVASAETGKPVIPGSVESLKEATTQTLSQ